MWKLKGFFPYIVVVFLNAFIDLGHKVLIQDTLYNTTTGHTFMILSALINALILLPYVLLFTPAGVISDRFSKTMVLRITAALEIPMTLILTASYFYGFFWFAFFGTLMLSMQSVVNSPAKYGFIKEMFGVEWLGKGNAWVQTTTIIAILSGTFVFTVLFSAFVSPENIAPVFEKAPEVLRAFYPLGFVLAALACVETFCALLLPKKIAADQKTKTDLKAYVDLSHARTYLSEVARSRLLLTCMVGLGIFWAINQVLLAGYGAYLKAYVPGADVVFAQGAMAIGGVGVLLGAGVVGRLSRGFIEASVIPLACVGMTTGLLLMTFLTHKPSILMLFLVYGFFGGMLVVPLNALIQFSAQKTHLGRMLAVNNFVQNVFMLTFLVATVLLTLWGANSLVILYSLFSVVLLATISLFWRLPQAFVKMCLFLTSGVWYRLRVEGLDCLPANMPVLLLGKQGKFIDWAIVQMASPRPVYCFFERWKNENNLMKKIMGALRLDSPDAVKTTLKQNHVVMCLSDIPDIAHQAQQLGARLLPYELSIAKGRCAFLRCASVIFLFAPE